MSTENSENVTMSVNEQLSEVEAPAAEAPVAEAPAAPPVTLTVRTLANVRSLLELAVNRGAFRANEMTAVGTVYDEFVGGLNTLAAQIQAAQPAAAPAEDAAPAEAATPAEDAAPEPTNA